MRTSPRIATERSGLERGPGAFVVAAAIAAVSVGTSCTLDPVHDKTVSNLGPENASLYPVESQYHRPGEPCAVCHSSDGPATTEFALAGTVFWGPDDYDARVDNAYVSILDANKTRRCFVTNCSGNFFVKKADWTTLKFPVLLAVERTIKPGQGNEHTLKYRAMGGHIGRESSCGTCHLQDPQHQSVRDFGSPGWIHLYDTQAEANAQKGPAVTCPPPPEYVQVQTCPGYDSP